MIAISCGRKAFPDERFAFSAKYRNLISPYHVGDTLHFDNDNGKTFRIAITGIDSTISNIKGGFLNPGPYKQISVYCDNLDYHKVNSKDTMLVFINIYPDSLEQSSSFSLMNFRGWIEDKDSMLSEFKTGPHSVFKNCFVIKNHASDLGEEPNDVEYIYVHETAGIIALRTYNGEWWLRR